MDFMLEAFLLAVAIDIVFGEPHLNFHPVAWIGKLIGFMDAHAPRRFRRIYGIFMALSTVMLAVTIGYGTVMTLYQLSPFISLLATAFLLKSTFSLSFLWQVSWDIYGDLKAGRIESARARLPALVGRNTKGLDEGHMASCVIESLGESFVDGILSPLFYFALFGIPGALAYRAINQLDAMVGYKDEKHRETGWASARIDDLANFVPARLAVLMMALVSGHPIRAIKAAMHDGRKAPSINSGYPMAAFGGALGVRLEKLGFYVLGEGLRPCGVVDITGAIRLNQSLSAILAAAIAIALWLLPLPLI